MKTRKTRVALLVGGPSSEHDISLESGRHVHRHLDKGKYEIVPVVVSRSGQWSVEPEDFKNMVDVAFVAMHGEYGEDGTLQELLRELDIPHTHSSVLPSNLAINKVMSNRVFGAHGMKTPKTLVFGHHELSKIGLEDLNLPVVVKPFDRGSALGTSIVRHEKDLKPALDRALSHSRKALVQEYIPGRELACAVLDDGLQSPFPLPVTEIRPKTGAIYDIQSRYTPSATELITPAHISDEDAGAVQAMAVRAHQAIGASGVSRTDIILGEDGHFYVLEINTIPGLSKASLLPHAAGVHGIEMPELLDRIIEAAFIRHKSLGSI